MGKWGLIFGSVIILTGLGTVYLAACVGRFGLIKKLADGKRWLRLLISYGVIGAVFGVLVLTMSTVNAAMVLLHEVLFFLIFGLAARIIRRVRGKDLRFNFQGWLAIGTSVVYLTVGWMLCHKVWKTEYSLSTDKEVGTLRIALIADSHLGTTFDAAGFAEHLRTIEEQSPDILLLPGDFIDDKTTAENMRGACEALGAMDLKYGVWFSYGNHDQGYYRKQGYEPSDLEKALTDSGIHVLNDRYELVDDRFYIVGRMDKSRGPDRKDMTALLEGADTDKYIIVLDHEPNDYDAEAASAADLVVSGHTHGGQLLPATFVGEWLGMNDKTYGYERRNDTDFIVTSGISDWELKFKTGTKSEYVIIDITGK